ncbi:3850_t:CDS:2 [Entrophospora sp. SA101]|nr:3850_t:CDS:2 [Entrophospora sp. SA101]
MELALTVGFQYIFFKEIRVLSYADKQKLSKELITPKSKSPIVIKTTNREVWIDFEDAPRKAYTFDNIFGNEANQQDIFDLVVVPMLGNLNSGSNTIISPNVGAIPRYLQYIFEALNPESAESADYSVKSDLKLQDDVNNIAVLHGHEEISLNNAAEGIRVLKQGSINRQTTSINYNNKSSRSHSVFTVTIHIKEWSLMGKICRKLGNLILSI